MFPEPRFPSDSTLLPLFQTALGGAAGEGNSRQGRVEDLHFIPQLSVGIFTQFMDSFPPPPPLPPSQTRRVLQGGKPPGLWRGGLLSPRRGPARCPPLPAPAGPGPAAGPPVAIPLPPDPAGACPPPRRAPLPPSNATRLLRRARRRAALEVVASGAGALLP